MKKNSTKKIELFIRDLGAIFLLFILLSIPTKRAVQFINAHQNSLLHELDGTLLAQLWQTRQQLAIATNLVSTHKTLPLEVLQELTSQLDQLEEQYKTNSHGYMLLGPIGSATIVLKERKVKNSLLQLSMQFRTVLLNALSTIPESESQITYNTLSENLASNTQLLRSLKSR